MTRDPKLTFGPACPFTPWDQSQQKQLHANRCEGEMGTGEKKRPLLTRQIGTGACSTLGLAPGGIRELSRKLGGTGQTPLMVNSTPHAKFHDASEAKLLPFVADCVVIHMVAPLSTSQNRTTPERMALCVCVRGSVSTFSFLCIFAAIFWWLSECVCTHLFES